MTLSYRFDYLQTSSRELSLSRRKRMRQLRENLPLDPSERNERLEGWRRGEREGETYSEGRSPLLGWIESEKYSIFLLLLWSLIRYTPYLIHTFHLILNNHLNVSFMILKCVIERQWTDFIEIINNCCIPVFNSLSHSLLYLGREKTNEWIELNDRTTIDIQWDTLSLDTLSLCDTVSVTRSIEERTLDDTDNWM